MTISLSIAAIIVVISFAVLVVFLAMTLTSVSRTLNGIAEMIAMLEKN